MQPICFAGRSGLRPLQAVDGNLLSLFGKMCYTTPAAKLLLNRKEVKLYGVYDYISDLCRSKRSCLLHLQMAGQGVRQRQHNKNPRESHSRGFSCACMELAYDYICLTALYHSLQTISSICRGADGYATETLRRTVRGPPLARTIRQPAG